MSAADRATFRRRLGDPVKADEDIVTTNGQDKTYLLRYNNLFDWVVMLDGVTQADDSSVYVMNSQPGKLVFNSVPADGQLLKVTYSYAAYTDAEADDMIATYGVDRAVIEALNGLLADSARLYNYQQGPTRADQSQIFDHLLKLRETYLKEADGGYKADDGSNIGGVMIGKRTNENYRPDPRAVQDLTRLDGQVLK